VFYDGSWAELGKACDWIPSKLCESNIAALWRLSKQVLPSLQLTHYEPGVAWSGATDDESGDFGTGTKQHMLNGYKWLAEQYHHCDEIFVFGFSRGALSARMLQGMIHHVGLAKSEHVAKAAGIHFTASAQKAAAFKNDKAWPGVRVKFLGLFDAVLRTLLHPIEHSNIESFAMQLSSSVDNFAHAIALGEYRETYESAELYTDPATNATQAWFMGVHRDVGGGLPNTGIARIPAGWMADEAVKAGLLLPTDWSTRPEMAINFMDDVFTENGLDARGTMFYGINVEQTLRAAMIRNPARCRRELGRQRDPILIHQSVWDRMQGNPGWVPLQYCCPKFEKAMENIGIQYVGSPHYIAAKAAYDFTRTPQWYSLKFQILKDAQVSEFLLHNPEYFLKVTNWHSRSSNQPPANAGASNGCCTVIDVKPPQGAIAQVQSSGDWWSPQRRGSLNFTGALVTLPYESAVADLVMIELYEADFFTKDDFLGRAELKYSDFGTWVDLDLGGGTTLRARADPIFTDDEAQQFLGHGDYAACQWLDRSTGLSRQEMCKPSDLDLSWILGSGLGSRKTCRDFVEDTMTGAL